MRDEQIGEVLKRTNKNVRWPTPLSTFAETFKWIEDIWKKGGYQKNNMPPLET
jgi:hypothetical protein